jgi:alpha-glucosidase
MTDVGAARAARPWWVNGVVYQIYPWSFADSNGDGIGDLAGITARLEYLAELGIDAIWLSPFYRSPMRDFGYDVADYTDVDPRFGTVADAEALFARVHELGLRVIIDLVPNHSSSDHPWFVASRSSRDDPRRDWYVWRDTNPARVDGRPNNWLSVFGGPAWTWDDATEAWYLHSFLPEQPDLNWRNPEVVATFDGILRCWLDRGVDGFRVDVAHFLMKDPELRDDPPAVRADEDFYKPVGEYGSLIHQHSLGHPDNLAIYRRWRAVMDEYGADRYMVCEIHDFSHDRGMKWLGDGDGMSHPFNFSLLKAAWEPATVQATIDSYEAAVDRTPGASGNWVLGNHDEHRVATRLGPEQVRAAAVLLLTLRGTTTLYYGEELGMADVAIPPGAERDPWGLRVPGLGLGRDPQRTPMLWDTTANAGFCPPGSTSWLPVGEQTTTHAAAVQAGDPGSTLALYRRLLTLRHTEPALLGTDYQPLPGAGGVVAYQRGAGADALVVLVNVTGAPVATEVRAGPVVLSTTDGEHPVATPIRLAPHEAVIARGSA